MTQTSLRMKALQEHCQESQFRNFWRDTVRLKFGRLCGSSPADSLTAGRL